MKKAGILLVLILSISFISAIDIELEKSSYNAMETLEAEITGGFIDNLVLNNINIYQNGSVHPVGTEANFVKYNDKYSYYAIVPETPGKYSLRIENTKHYVGTKESDETVEKNFTVTESTNSYLNYKPGFIYTSKDFSMTITAFNKNQDITVDFPEAGFKQTFNLGYNQVKTIYISIANITNTTESEIKIGSYSLPAIIIKSPSPVNNTNKTIIDLEDDLRMNPREINATMLEDTEDFYEIYIESDAGIIEDLQISSPNPNIIVSPDSFSEVFTRKVISVKIIGKEDFNSFINLSIFNSSVIIPVNIQITTNISKVDYSDPPVNIGQTCAEMSGKYCLEGQTCSALQKTDSIGNLCCIGECLTSSSGGSKWVWGVLIILALGAGGWFLYNKSKEGRDFKKTTSDIIAKRSEDYKKRLEAEPKEVRSGLTKT